jgi:Na+/proline symporter
MILSIIIACYFIPILIIGWYVYKEMEKGQTVEDYIMSNEYEEIAPITLVPIVNIGLSCIVIHKLVWNKIKNLKKL